jgi:AcrR family transcriptional regulator
MSPRPRTASNAEILEGAIRAISRLGPVRLTLADVAREVGLAPATLLQRFGSKRALLLAVVEFGVKSVEDRFIAVRAAHSSPLAALLAAATDMSRHVQSPDSLANHLAFRQIDLSDPDFHRLALESSNRIRAGYQALIEEAVAVGELLPCEPAALARGIQAVAGGSQINWAIHRDGTLMSWLRKDLDTLLTPYRGSRPAFVAAADRAVRAAVGVPLPPPLADAVVPRAEPPAAPRAAPRARHANASARRPLPPR